MSEDQDRDYRGRSRSRDRDQEDNIHRDNNGGDGGSEQQFANSSEGQSTNLYVRSLSLEVISIFCVL